MTARYSEDAAKCDVLFIYRFPFEIGFKAGLTAAMNQNDLNALVAREMPFGKFQGRLIADLPGYYLNWFAREGFPHGEIGRLLALMYEIDHNGLKWLLDPLRSQISD